MREKKEKFGNKRKKKEKENKMWRVGILGKSVGLKKKGWRLEIGWR